MKLLIYGINFAPEMTGIGKYTGELAEWLAARGHEVRVVTAPPYYPQWSVWPAYRGLRYASEQWRGVGVTRAPLWVPEKVSGVRRLIHLASFAATSLPALFSHWRWRPDVVWIAVPALACAPGALAFARLRNARSWIHIQDYEVDAAFELGMLKGGRLRKAITSAEQWLLRRFDRVSTISQRMLERASSKGVESSKLRHLPNWVDVSAIRPAYGANSYRAELGVADDAVVALYSGNMGEKQGLGILADIALALRDQPKIQFVYCGAGAGREGLVQRCAGLPNVRFLDLQPVERLQDLLAMADIHMLPQRADAADLVMPSKLTGMLSSGRPVIAGARPGTELAGVVSACGIVVAPDDAPAFTAAIESLASQPARRRELGVLARTWAEEHLAQDAILTRFEDDLRHCIAAAART